MKVSVDKGVNRVIRKIGNKRRWIIGVAGAFLFLGTPVRAQNSQTLLISKLENVYGNLAPADAARTTVGLRLADLLSERARRSSMEELGKGCSECHAGDADRKRAIALYEEFLPKVGQENRDKITFQIAHLEGLLGRTAQSLARYQEIVRRNQTPQWVVESQMALAESDFKMRKYADAEKAFGKVIERKEATGYKGLALYRQAWCRFQQNKFEGAIQNLREILNSPALLTRAGSSAQVVAVDTQFHEEVSRDFATFSSRLPIQNTTIEEIYALSPQNVRIENVTYLASELDRLGQAKAGITVWEWVYQKQQSPKGRLEAQVRMAHLSRSLDQQAAAVSHFKIANELFAQNACPESESNCKDLLSFHKKFLIDWYTAAKSRPTEDLYQAFVIFLPEHLKETELVLAGVQVAKSLNHQKEAFAWVDQCEKDVFAALQSSPAQELKTQGAQGKENKSKSQASMTTATLETMLLNLIDLAEQMKDASLRKVAYERYLSDLPKGKKALEVRYQRAHLLYEANQNEEAASALKEVALSCEKDNLKASADQELCVQSAHLSLDALVLAKKETLIEPWSLEYASNFKSERAEFETVLRKASLNRAAEILNQKEISEVQLAAASASLAQVPMKDADEADRIKWLKDRLIIAEKLKKYGEARTIVSDLLLQKSLSAADRAYVLSRSAWLAELNLDFKTAFESTKKLEADAKDKQGLAMRLGFLAELARENPKPYYEDFVKHEKDKKLTAPIEAKLIQLSRDPQTELLKSKGFVQANPGLAAQMQLEFFAQNKNPKNIEAFLKLTSASAPAVDFLKRIQFLSQNEKIVSAIEKDQIKSKNDRELGASLKRRIKLMEELEKSVGAAISSKDWTSQVVALNAYQKQTKRFYDEVLSLPTPAGLTEDQQAQYLQLLSEQVGPYLTKSQDAEKKLAEFWSDKTAIEGWLKAAQTTPNVLHALMKAEVDRIEGIAPAEFKEDLKAASTQLSRPPVMPEFSALESARAEVKSQPLNITSLEKLRTLEREMGHQTMADYLNLRILQAKGDSEKEAVQ